MGSYVGWHCESCGAEECFYYGGGMRGFNDPELVKNAMVGNLGPAMKTLFSHGVPEGWTLFNERAFYECPNCETPLPGAVTRIDDGSGNWLTFHVSPGACASCGAELAFWDDKVPMGRGELLSRCMGFSMGDCPKCGGGPVQLDLGKWD